MRAEIERISTGWKTGKASQAIEGCDDCVGRQTIQISLKDSP